MLSNGLALLVPGSALASGAVDQRIREFESSLRPAVSVEGQPQQRWVISERMAHWKVPGLSLAVIRNGKVAWAKGYGVLQAGKADAVDTNTVFSVGSVSKVGTAAVTLRLVDAGKLDLDRDVNGYLTRWKLPATLYTAVHPVTLRGILSHSAGLTVGGFDDFQPGESLPTVFETLDGAGPAKEEPVRVVYVPGSRIQYSGGGTTIEELVINEVTGLDFPSAARRYVFEPLRMERSTYESPLPESHGNIAKAHGEDGKPRALPRGYEAMPQMAASGLWTTPTEYAQLVIALIKSYRGEAGSFLSTSVAHQMMTEVGRSLFGLGPQLEGQGMGRRFCHAGSNESYKAWMEGHLGTGNGVVVFTNGANGASLYPEVLRAVAVAEGWAAALSYHERVPAVALSAAELEQDVGLYEVQPGPGINGYRHRVEDVAFRIDHRDGALHLGDAEGNRRLIAEDAARFVTEDGRTRIEFVRNYSGRVTRLMMRLPGAVIEAERVGED